MVEAMEYGQFIQLGALGILGFIVIGGFILFRWGVQKWLPSFLEVLKDGFDAVTSAVKELSLDTKVVSARLEEHENGTKRFDVITQKMMSKIDNVAMIQNDHSTSIERLCSVQEELIKNSQIPRELIERQTAAFEKLSEQLEEIYEKDSD
jgi:hypothetical protein